MELVLPKYTIPEYMLSPQAGNSSSEGLENNADVLDDHSRLTGKRRRTSSRSALLMPVSDDTGLLQYTFPDSLLFPQAILSSHGDLKLQAPLNDSAGPDCHDSPTTVAHSELSINTPLRSDPACIALNNQCEAQKDSLLSPPRDIKQSEDPSRNTSISCQSSDGSLRPISQATANIMGNEYDCHLDMSHETFSLDPAMTHLWGELPALNTPWSTAMELPSSLHETMKGPEPDVAVAGVAADRCELVSEREVSNTHTAISMAMPLPRWESRLNTSASPEVRLSYVLKAVAAAGFDSLDDAVVQYYTNPLENDQWLRQEQRLSRLRRLPVLLKELHLAAQCWGQWQRRNFQEQIIKSTEDILIAELEDHLVARLSDQAGPACKHKARNKADIEAELPNTWAFLTSLSTRYNTIASKDSQNDVPKPVARFLATVTDLGTRKDSFI